ncbi:hypothetical protein M569_13234 [Genlisea aurea]|uniref:Uncharacterized protein n=1 Tax=Genlisea aurea TaxID=192259 RepID=S8CB04_9LAMI|nr:hypothetical protein M569_13234 [Genlisea aurea]
MGDENMWNAVKQNPEVKKMTSAAVVMATEKSSTPGLLEGAPAPFAGGGGNVFDNVFAVDTHIEDPYGAPRKVSRILKKLLFTLRTELQKES